MITIVEARKRLRTADMAVSFGLPWDWILCNILKRGLA